MPRITVELFSYVFTALLSALLLFVVQPLAGKSLLPWFGGTPAVWTTSMMFFQALLLAGYAYAHLVVDRFSVRNQIKIHGSLLFVSLIMARILPGESWAPAGTENPTVLLLAILTVHVGLPFFALSATSPLFQSWFSRRYPDRSPYPLYAVSNAGSLIAVLAYPFFIERIWSLSEQQTGWIVGYALFLAGFFLCARSVWKLSKSDPNETASSTTAREPEQGAEDTETPRKWNGSWITLSACGSVLLLATTDQISQDVAASPVFWVVPFGLYLLSYVIGFSGLYRQKVWLFLLPIAAGGVAGLLLFGSSWPVSVQLFVYAASLFIGCTACHGELSRIRPEAASLTRYYLSMSTGGALGGVLVAVVAPLLLPNLWEFSLGWLATVTLVIRVVWREEGLSFNTSLPSWIWATLFAGWTVSALCFTADLFLDHRQASMVSRSFFGRLGVTKLKDKTCLYHGRIRHGCQWSDPNRTTEPTTYYGRDSGVGIAVETLRTNPKTGPLRIGIVGLGIGTCAAWGNSGDAVRFYELDPNVAHIARNEFTYLVDSPAEVDVKIGDARLALKSESVRKEPLFDVLVLDAFSGDAVPLHLLTREAFDIYWSRLAPGGVLAAHISNRYVHLEPVILGSVAETGRPAMLVYTEDDSNTMSFASTWVLTTADREVETLLRSTGHMEPWPEEHRTPILFTDQRSDLLSILM